MIHKNQTYLNGSEPLTILGVNEHEVKYRKQHRRPKKDDQGRHIGGTEPYYHTYTIGTDRAQRHIDKRFWVLKQTES